MSILKHTVRLFALGLIVLFADLGVEAQIVLRGRVLEASGSPLSFANVRLVTSQGKLQGGQATNQDGAYRIANLPAGTYTLEVSYVGYKTHSAKVTLLPSDTERQLKDITLTEDGLLQELLVTGKATEVTMKGDTIEYNAGSFTTSQGAALEELVKKLPGAEVDESGKITVNGKSVTQIMVDGKRFFESDPKVALKNLPAELVEKVQVMDKQSDNARMTGFSDGEDETVINLTIKPGRKQGLFGTILAGAGNKQRYEGNAIINRFTGEDQWTILGGLNNTNNAGFADLAADMSALDIAQQASGSSRRMPWQRNNSNDGITSSRILGGNAILTIDARTQAGGNAFVGNSDKTLETKGETTTIETGGTNVESSTATERNKKWSLGTNLRLEWKPDSLTEVILAPRLSYGTGTGLLNSQTHAEYTITGSTTASNVNDLDIIQDTESRTYDGQVNLDVSRRLSERGRTLALALRGSFTGTHTWGSYLADATGTLNDINQDLDYRERNTSFRARASYVEPLGNGFALQATYQIRSSLNSGERSAWDNLLGIASSTGTYTLESNLITHRAGLAIKKTTKTLDVTLGVNIDPSRLESTTTQGGTLTSITQSVTNFSPTFRVVYKTGKAFNLRLDYRGQSFQPSVNQLSPINDGTNPLVVTQGNPNLLPGFRHMLFGMMSLFSAAKQSSLNFFFGGNMTQNNIVSQSTYDAVTGVRTTSYTNVNGTWGINFGGFFTTPLPGKRFSLRLGTRNSYNNDVGFVASDKNHAKTLALTEEVGLTYRHGFLDTSLKGSLTYAKVSNSLPSAAGSTTRDYGVHWDTNLSLPMNFQIESQVRYNTTSGYASGFNYEQTLVNLGLSYSFLKGKVATLRFKVYDLLGQQRNVYRNVTALSISSQETNIIGRYAMLHFIYKFNSFSVNASAADMKSMQRGPGGPPPGRF